MLSQLVLRLLAASIRDKGMDRSLTRSGGWLRSFPAVVFTMGPSFSSHCGVDANERIRTFLQFCHSYFYASGSVARTPQRAMSDSMPRLLVAPGPLTSSLFRAHSLPLSPSLKGEPSVRRFIPLKLSVYASQATHFKLSHPNAFFVDGHLWVCLGSSTASRHKAGTQPRQLLLIILPP